MDLRKQQIVGDPPTLSLRLELALWCWNRRKPETLTKNAPAELSCKEWRAPPTSPGGGDPPPGAHRFKIDHKLAKLATLRHFSLFFDVKIGEIGDPPTLFVALGLKN